MTLRRGLNFAHIGIFVTDVSVMLDFYTCWLEFTQTDRGTMQTAKGPAELAFLSRDPDEHHQIVLISGRPEHIDFNVVNQISLKADSLKTLKEFHARLQKAPITELMPVTHGNALSLYFRDPEGNRIELYVDTPWYVDQPMRVAAPFDLPEQALLDWCEQHARKLPGFRPRSEWRAEMVKRMDAHN